VISLHLTFYYGLVFQWNVIRHNIPELGTRTFRFLYVLYASNLRTGVNEHIHLQTCNLISLFYFGCRWFSVYSYFVGGKVQQGYTHTHGQPQAHTHANTQTDTHRRTTENICYNFPRKYFLPRKALSHAHICKAQL